MKIPVPAVISNTGIPVIFRHFTGIPVEKTPNIGIPVNTGLSEAPPLYLEFMSILSFKIDTHVYILNGNLKTTIF